MPETRPLPDKELDDVFGMMRTSPQYQLVQKPDKHHVPAGHDDPPSFTAVAGTSRSCTEERVLVTRNDQLVIFMHVHL